MSPCPGWNMVMSPSPDGNNVMYPSPGGNIRMSPSPGGYREYCYVSLRRNNYIWFQLFFIAYYCDRPVSGVSRRCRQQFL